MTNKQFIKEFVERLYTDNDNKRHGNLFYEDNVLYSYGHHYPLCLNLNGDFIINSDKYSSSTSKQKSCVVQVLNELNKSFILLNTDNINLILQKNIQKLSEAEKILNTMKGGTEQNG